MAERKSTRTFLRIGRYAINAGVEFEELFLKSSQRKREDEMKKKLIPLLFIGIFLIFGCVPTNPTTPTNPVNNSSGMPDNWPLTGNTSVHDPGIIKAGGTYYIYGTGVGIEVKRSQDGLNWSTIGKVFNTYPSWANRYVPNHESNIWAPDIQYYNGKYYLYYSVSTFGKNISAIGMATSTSLPYNWSDQGMVITSTSSNNYNCIDPNLVIDNSGRPWLAFGSFWSGLKIIELDPATMKPKSGAAVRSIASRPSTAIEAPYIVYRNGYYYLFASIDKCCQGANSTYKIIFGRSQNITGPYVDKSGNSLMNGGGTLFDAGNERWKGPGGQSLLGTQAIAHHAYDASNNGAATLMIKNLYWDSNGWPYKDGGASSGSGSSSGSSSSSGCN